MRTEPGVSDSLIGTPTTLSMPGGGVLDRLHHLAREYLRIGERLGDIAHGAAGHSGLRQDLDPVCTRARAQDRRQPLSQLGVMNDAGRIGREPGILAQRAQRQPPRRSAGTDRRCRRRERNSPSAAANVSYGAIVACRFPTRPERMPRGQVHRRVIAQNRDHAIEHADVHLLTAASPLARIQGKHDPLSGQHARDQVGDGDTDPKRRPFRIARDAHQPAFRLHHGVVSGLGCLRAGLPESGDRCVDQLRLRVLQRRVVEAEPGQRARPEVFDDDVGLVERGDR